MKKKLNINIPKKLFLVYQGENSDKLNQGFVLTSFENEFFNYIRFLKMKKILKTIMVSEPELVIEGEVR